MQVRELGKVELAFLPRDRILSSMSHSCPEGHLVAVLVGSWGWLICLGKLRETLRRRHRELLGVARNGQLGLEFSLIHATVNDWPW